MAGQEKMTDQAILDIYATAFCSGAVTALAEVAGVDPKTAEQWAHAHLVMVARDPAVTETILEQIRPVFTDAELPAVGTPEALEGESMLQMRLYRS